jgi:hypothetical protein
MFFQLGLFTCVLDKTWINTGMYVVSQSSLLKLLLWDYLSFQRHSHSVGRIPSNHEIRKGKK